MHHYRCYRVWVKSSRPERITDTLAWLPSKLRMPVPLPADRIYRAAQDLTAALLASTSFTSPGLPDHATAALTTLTEIFANFSKATSSVYSSDGAQSNQSTSHWTNIVQQQYCTTSASR
jgi:hypothetical protein